MLQIPNPALIVSGHVLVGDQARVMNRAGGIYIRWEKLQQPRAPTRTGSLMRGWLDQTMAVVSVESDSVCLGTVYTTNPHLVELSTYTYLYYIRVFLGVERGQLPPPPRNNCVFSIPEIHYVNSANAAV